MKEKILELREKGYTYNQIKKELGCSKGTISYHLGYGQKEKSYDRLKKQRKLLPWLKKSDNFFDLYRDKKLTHNKIGSSYSRNKLKDYLKTINKCYLSGREIDINDPGTYEFDHITPKVLGGECSFENLGITRPEANRAKNTLTVEEFILLCKDVLINFGYTVTKSDTSL